MFYHQLCSFVFQYLLFCSLVTQKFFGPREESLKSVIVEGEKVRGSQF